MRKVYKIQAVVSQQGMGAVAEVHSMTEILKKRLLPMLLVFVILTAASMAFAKPTPPGHEIKIMTQNLYLGTDMLPIITASSFPQLLGAISSRWAQAQQTDFPARAELIADEIANEMPDLVALQECVTWRTGPFNQPPASHIVYDYLAILQQALAQRGLPYEVIAVENGYDVEGPGLFSTGLMDVRLSDHEVILARTDRSMIFTNAAGVNFTKYLTVPIFGGGYAELKRGYCTVDVRFHGKNCRIIATHLEPDHPLINTLQSQEILNNPADTDMNVIYVGDFNSPAAGGSPFTAYQQALAAGFEDAWSACNPDDAGNTFGHTENLLDAVDFTERIDFAVYKGNVVPTRAILFGLDSAQRTPAGLWPSDHAGLITTFVVK